MSTTPLHDLPPALAARPIDPKRGVPIPAVNEQSDGTADYVSINGRTAVILAGQGCCSLCTEPMTGLVAFLGGPRSADAHSYSDPPMHESCAEAALRLCPHMARQHARRATRQRVPEGTVVPEGFSEEKPDEWVMVLTADFATGLVPAEGGGFVPVFVSSRHERTRQFVYNDGALVEKTGR
ncbi:hypothetical protein OG196_31985 [Kitasatospora purpeofusca]|uniref:hypothetical protein n=1 Tax=Kitasatospora purpeofusca TaxID=67352 RepID=UPI002E13311F|nr:hypothetical protein OG196_31985 [Kitasatospora purpeofusca]